MQIETRLQAALHAARAACTVAREVQHGLARVQAVTKDDKSPVTVADFAVQAVVAMSLHESLGPSTLIVGEEHTRDLPTPQQRPVLDAVVQAVRTVRPAASAESVLAAIDHCDHDGTASMYWTLDPVDGTKGFLRGQQYAIALALIERGHVTLGVMGCPNLPAEFDAPLDRAAPSGMLCHAMPGAGAWWQAETAENGPPSRMQSRGVSPSSDRRRPLITCESVEAAHSSQDDSARILERIGTTGAPLRLDSQCKYALVARGQADAYLRLPTGRGYVEKIWDHAAGSIIAAEAGAIVSDIAGRPLDFSHGRLLTKNRGVIAAAPDVHAGIINAIDELGLAAPSQAHA